jgi:hypothetical protein
MFIKILFLHKKSSINYKFKILNHKNACAFFFLYREEFIRNSNKETSILKNKLCNEHSISTLNRNGTSTIL